MSVDAVQLAVQFSTRGWCVCNQVGLFDKLWQPPSDLVHRQGDHLSRESGLIANSIRNGGYRLRVSDDQPHCLVR